MSCGYLLPRCSSFSWAPSRPGRGIKLRRQDFAFGEFIMTARIMRYTSPLCWQAGRLNGHISFDLRPSLTIRRTSECITSCSVISAHGLDSHLNRLFRLRVGSLVSLHSLPYTD